jgi:3-hydroxybutyryl-CoA dehydratase
MPGLPFEAFQVGQTITSDEITITAADVNAFAALTGDTNPIHLDAEYAASHAFGQRVAHGLLGLSVAIGLAWKVGFLEGTILALREIDRWKFSTPIYLNDRIRVRTTVSETKLVRRLGGGLVTFGVEILNQNDAVVQHGNWIVLVISQESDSP